MNKSEQRSSISDEHLKENIVSIIIIIILLGLKYEKIYQNVGKKSVFL
jgi:hypothetical protein